MYHKRRMSCRKSFVLFAYDVLIMKLSHQKLFAERNIVWSATPWNFQPVAAIRITFLPCTYIWFITYATQHYLLVLNIGQPLNHYQYSSLCPNQLMLLAVSLVAFPAPSVLILHYYCILEIYLCVSLLWLIIIIVIRKLHGHH